MFRRGGKEGQMATKDIVRTRIQGLDAILLGGIPRSNAILVQGVAGSGKTLMGVEFIYRGAVQFNEPGIIVVFETSPDKIIRDASGFGWNLEELQQQQKLQIVFTSPQVFDQELRMPNSLLMEMAAEIGARRIFVDGIGQLSLAGTGGGPTPVGGAGSYRELLQQLIEAVNRQSLTAMFSHE